jgi:hypothetical protein
VLSNSQGSQKNPNQQADQPDAAENKEEGGRYGQPDDGQDNQIAGSGLKS